MTRKQTRLTIILVSLSLVAAAAGLILYAIRDTIVFFFTPSEITEKNIAHGTRIRLGGLVEQGSLLKSNGTEVSFTVTDGTGTLKVRYNGQLPDLFREGQGVVAEGAQSMTRTTCRKMSPTS
jgi:cytochrome c-type biogenesis protein CcmE